MGRKQACPAFPLRVPVKEVLPSIIKQGVNCLESQGQDTAGNFLLGVGICRGSAKNPPAPQVSCSGPGVGCGAFLCSSSSLHLHSPQTHFPRDPAGCPLPPCSLGLLLSRSHLLSSLWHSCPLCTTRFLLNEGEMLPKQRPALSWDAAVVS